MADLPLPGAPRIRYLVIDVADLDRAARFWGRLLQVGIAGRDAHHVWLEPRGSDPALVLQLVEEPKVGKNRVHLDLSSTDPAATLAQVQELGGRIVRRVEEPDYALVVLADPDGNELCLILRGSQVTRRSEPRP